MISNENIHHTFFHLKNVASIVSFYFIHRFLNLQKGVHNEHELERTDCWVGRYHLIMLWCFDKHLISDLEKSLGLTIPLIHLKNILITINTVLSIICQFNGNFNYVRNTLIVYHEAFMVRQIDPFCKFSVSVTGSLPGASHWLLWRHRLHELMDSWLWGRGSVSVVSGADTH